MRALGGDDQGCLAPPVAAPMAPGTAPRRHPGAIPAARRASLARHPAGADPFRSVEADDAVDSIAPARSRRGAVTRSARNGPHDALRTSWRHASSSRSPRPMSGCRVGR